MNEQAFFGVASDVNRLMGKRKRLGGIWRILFILATSLAIVFLILLIFSIINSVFGYAVLRNDMNPGDLVSGTGSVSEFSRLDLEEIARTRLSSGILRRVEYDKPIAQRTDKDLVAIVEQYVVKPKVLRTWGLWESLTRSNDVRQYVADNEGTYATFRSWLTPAFIVADQSSDPLLAGVRTAMLGSLWVILITLLFSFPIGVSAAIYLQEYAKKNRLNHMLQLNIFNLSAVPSIIYGLLGLAVFVRFMEPITSGALIMNTMDNTANGRTILSGGLTLGLLVLPIIIINTQEALKGVPDTLRMASYGIGATKWQTIWYQVLPSCFDRILTGL